MGDSEAVHASRDGDWFHYYWAACRSLQLLDPAGDLTVVGVEGLPEPDRVEGEEVIDVAEYHGGFNAATCTRFRYAQLKHSTVRTDDRITASELRKTLTKFAMIYRTRAGEGNALKSEFAFVANRLLDEKVRVTLAELTCTTTSFTYPRVAKLMQGYMGFTDRAMEADFCRRFLVEDDAPDVRSMEWLLQRELDQFLPGGGTGTELAQLMSAVSLRATSSVAEHTLTKADVLLALRTTAEQLFPAVSKIETLDNLIPTEDINGVVDTLITGPNVKVLVTAVGGVGKSVLTSALTQALPDGSLAVVYDCFAGGDYRKASSPRHEHRVALTEIVNELAAQGSCTPLIPTTAPPALYMQVFMKRIRAISADLADSHPDALLTVVVDAADNAAIASDEQGDRTFVTDLFREDWPPNSRVVQMCRPERKHLLKVPAAGVTEISLTGFSKIETLLHLQSVFPDASAGQGAELQALSGGNPRVQAMAMQNAHSVQQALGAIQFARDAAPANVLDTLLASQVEQIGDQGQLLRADLQRLCGALATLPPPVPLSDLAALTSMDVDAIRSFAVALGRGLYAADDVLQFRDEPTETWFRSNHGLDSGQKCDFATVVGVRAQRSPYCASALPQLLFEANMITELVDLALSDASLPGEPDGLQAQEIARSRARFALGAMLQSDRNADAALLAVKVGAMSSGHSRRTTMFRTHADLTARFLDTGFIDTLCGSQELAVGWPGSNLHVEALLLSHIDQFQDMARSRLRSATNNIDAILRLPDDRKQSLSHNITVDEIADLALTATNIDGIDGGVDYLSQWAPETLVHEAASKVCRRLADAGQDKVIDQFIGAGRSLGVVQLAAARTMFEYNLVPSDDAVENLIVLLRDRTEPFERQSDQWSSEPDVRAVVWAVTHGVRTGCLDDPDALRILDVHLPDRLPDSVASRALGIPPLSLLLGFALRSRLCGRVLELTDVVSDNMLALLERPSSTEPYVQEFRANVPQLLPWAECWLAALLDGDSDTVAARLTDLPSSNRGQVNGSHLRLMLFNAVAEMAVRTLAAVPRPEFIDCFAAWCQANDPTMARSRIPVARIAVRSPDLEVVGLEIVARGVSAVQNNQPDAEARISSLIELARTLLCVNETEAREIFQLAVVAADMIGDDLHARWQSLTNTAKVLASGDEPARAYRLFQIGGQLDRGLLEIGTREMAQRMHDMHRPTYFSAVSRARDRRTFSIADTLTPAFDAAPEFGDDSLGGLALYAFELYANWRPIVARLSPVRHAHTTKIFEQFTRYARDWSDIPQRRAHASRTYGSVDDRSSDTPEVRFGECDFTTEDGWNRALGCEGWGTEERTALAEFALDKHPTHRPGVLDALGRATTASRYHFSSLAVAAAQRTQTPGLIAARKRLGATMTTRFARELCIRPYDDETITDFAAAADTTIGELRRKALRVLGHEAHQLRHDEYFHLAACLAGTLEPDAAAAVFDSLAALFEEVAPSGTCSDGPFASLPAPPAGTATCIAGLIWAALGDIAANVRWRAAHAVLLLTQLGCREELEALARFAEGHSSVKPFLDARFPFYSLHARMWLLLALRRAIEESDTTDLTPFGTWLTDVTRGPRHAVNQFLAQQILVAMSAAGSFTVADEDSGLLNRRLTAEFTEIPYADRDHRPNPLAHQIDNDEIDHNRYRFFFDFEHYWCERVADIFGSTESNVEYRAADVAAELDGYDVFVADSDPRARANVYNTNWSQPNHSEWPGEEILSFYIGIHALLTVAAELAQSTPAYKDPDLPDDAYTEWLAQFLPTRTDGRWLADRRDPPPQPAPERALAEHSSLETWPWSISKHDFEVLAGTGTDWVTVWATVYAGLDQLSEDSSIESAFVPRGTARSLLAALQTAKPSNGPFLIRIPTTDDPFNRPSTPPYELRPWINVASSHEGIDQYDVRAADLGYPPARPADDIVDQFGLTTDDDMRTWFHHDAPAFRSRTWSSMSSSASFERPTGTRGGQLDVHHQFLTTTLQELDMSLVIRTGIRRSSDRSTRRRREEGNDEFDWIEWSGKIYIVNPSGQWFEY